MGDRGEPIGRMMEDRRLQVSLLVSLVMGTMLVSLDFVATDAAHHMFFAKHYADNWFSLYTQHIGGGTVLNTYPPLVYQAMAVLSFVVSLKMGYNILLIASWMVLALSSAKFFVGFLEVEKSDIWMVYMFIFGSVGLLKAIFVHGQLTTVVGMAFGFTALYFLNRAMNTGEEVDFLFFGVSYALVAFSHQFSFVLTGFLIAFVLLSRHKSVLNVQFIRNFGLVSALAAVLSAAGLVPFLLAFLQKATGAIQHIPHYSRKSLFSRSLVAIKSTFYLTYGISALMIALPLYLHAFDKELRSKYLKLYGVGMFFLVMGLGFTTPLPELVFFSWADWITYDRFALVASIIFTAFLVIFVKRKVESGGFENEEIVLLAVTALFIAVNLAGLFQAHTIAYGDPVETSDPYRESITEYMSSFLSRHSSSYRYQTFGYGDPIAQLYLKTGTPTLDTWYFTGRQIPWLKGLGVETIDSANRTVIRKFMRHADNESVKYIFTLRPKYHRILEGYNWTKIEEKNFGDRKIAVWENPGKIPRIRSIEKARTLENYLWGVVPLSAFVLFVLFYSVIILRKNSLEFGICL